MRCVRAPHALEEAAVRGLLCGGLFGRIGGRGSQRTTAIAEWYVMINSGVLLRPGSRVVSSA